MADLFLHVLQMHLVGNPAVGRNNTHRGSDAAVNAKDRSSDPDGVVDVFAVGDGQAGLTDFAKLCQKAAPAGLRKGLRAV